MLVILSLLDINSNKTRRASPLIKAPGPLCRFLLYLCSLWVYSGMIYELRKNNFPDTGFKTVWRSLTAKVLCVTHLVNFLLAQNCKSENERAIHHYLCGKAFVITPIHEFVLNTARYKSYSNPVRRQCKTAGLCDINSLWSIQISNNNLYHQP